MPAGTERRFALCQCERRATVTVEETPMTIEQRETTSLIGSDKVAGTAVYGSDEKKIGTVERVMLDKLSGKVAYAVIGYGGLLGIGDDHYPTPWANLKYDTRLGGYVIGITADQLNGVPKYSNDNDWAWSRDNDERIYAFYGPRHTGSRRRRDEFSVWSRAVQPVGRVDSSRGTRGRRNLSR
jgi:hypothetical protein